MKACKECIKSYRLNDKVKKAEEIGDECYWCCKRIIIKKNLRNNLDTRLTQVNKTKNKMKDKHTHKDLPKKAICWSCLKVSDIERLMKWKR